jgi:cysteine dioxygenase
MAFVQRIHDKLRCTLDANNPRNLSDDAIQALREWFAEEHITAQDVKQWASWNDAEGAFTRNLIDTDGTTYTLLLLCWNRGGASVIHDHASSHCFLKAIEGSVLEQTYALCPRTSEVAETARTVLPEQDASFINDARGLHKISNVSADLPAQTLHLYIPPYQECRVYDASTRTSSTSPMRMYQSK